MAGAGWVDKAARTLKAENFERCECQPHFYKKEKQTLVEIHMDDFGTGYSSMSLMKHFPIDTIKIDRSFVAGIGDSQSDEALASAIVALANGSVRRREGNCSHNFWIKDNCNNSA